MYDVGPVPLGTEPSFIDFTIALGVVRLREFDHNRSGLSFPVEDKAEYDEHS